MLKPLSQQVHQQLINQGMTIAVAESCTGGQLSTLLTSLPGASNYFVLGAVTYSNRAKEKILRIPAKLISKYGAVSKSVAILMAQNIRKVSQADLGLSITGIAGPAGAVAKKPVGTVCLCLAAKKKSFYRKFIFSGNRSNIQHKAVQAALRLLCAYLSP